MPCQTEFPWPPPKKKEIFGRADFMTLLNFETLWGPQFFLREALFTFVGKSKTDVPSVRPFGGVRSENNHFLPAAYEGWTHLWQQWGFENPILKKLKKSGQSVRINGKYSQVWTDFWTPFLNFWKTSSWRGLRHLIKKLKNLENRVL